MIKRNTGFTLVEAITVVGIICILATLTVVTMKSLRVNGRDARRISDITEIRSALSLYYAKYNKYPDTITPGQSFKIGSLVYLEKVPMNPVPKNDGTCTGDDYIYATQNNNISYTLNFCLGNNIAGLQAGNNQATPASILSYTAPPQPGVKISLIDNNRSTSEIADSKNPKAYTEFSIALSAEPRADVNIYFTASTNSLGGIEATIEPSNITFSREDWKEDKIIKVVGYNDDYIEDSGTNYTVNFQVTSSDDGYNNLAISPLSFINFDECGNGGSGGEGPEKGMCNPGHNIFCSQTSRCPSAFACGSNPPMPFEPCGEGEKCWRDSDCASEHCLGINPPDPGVCQPDLRQ